MGSLPEGLAAQLRSELGLVRAVETGTYGGGTARVLAGMFPSATTIELSDELHRRAAAALAGIENLTLLHGSSPEALATLERPPGGTLYWLDAHWSGGETAGREHPCPVVEEIRAIGPGHPDDCLLIDDARLFNDPAWPSIAEVMNAILAERPGHHVTIAHDLIVAVPARARGLVDAFAKRNDEVAYRAAEEGRVGRRRARLNRVLVHPAYLRLLRALVRLKRALAGSRAARAG
jgi:hypothetical protein